MSMAQCPKRIFWPALLNIFLVTVTLRAPLASLSMTLSCVVWQTWWREGMPSQDLGPGEAWEVSLCKPHIVQQGQVLSTEPGSGQAQAQAQVEVEQRIEWEQAQVEGLGVFTEEKLNTNQQCALAALRGSLDCIEGRVTRTLREGCQEWSRGAEWNTWSVLSSSGAPIMRRM